MGDTEEGNKSSPKNDTKSSTASPKNSSSRSFDTASALPYLGIIVSGAILLAALLAKSRYEGHRYYGYGIALAVVGMFVAIVALALVEIKKDDTQVVQYCNYFNFVWCFTGACIMTFGGPFKFTGNGYFASWGMAVFSIVALGASQSDITGMDSVSGLLAAAIITVIAVISDWTKGYQGELIYAIIIAGLTIFVCLAMIKGGSIPGASALTAHRFPVLAFFAVAWILVAGLLTFRGPFLLTGNGYFGVWGGAFASIYAASSARNAS